ncbi:MAG: CDP-diacylglycerol--glycerol-3-phosphate 3-phosphatidyltransferase [Candidatus Hydrogenedentes bacterium]|nr:CDP-diacylglycerol--glycerol-3-phosphate 3-phosphatidyltransferase [Candidatus Hydrogenedentota bacterium]
MNLPNQLTLARVIMAPIFILLMSLNHLAAFILAYVVFVAATITDYYDGKIAQERNLVTNFGKLWDPVADKVLITAAFVMLMKLPDLHIPGWTVVVIIAREFLITSARSHAASDGVVIAANRWGKTKAVIQMVYVFTFLFFVIAYRTLNLFWDGGAEGYGAYLRRASEWAIVFVALYTVYSGVQFARLNWQVLKPGSLA